MKENNLNSESAVIQNEWVLWLDKQTAESNAEFNEFYSYMEKDRNYLMYGISRTKVEKWVNEKIESRALAYKLDNIDELKELVISKWKEYVQSDGADLEQCEKFYDWFIKENSKYSQIIKFEDADLWIRQFSINNVLEIKLEELRERVCELTLPHIKILSRKRRSLYDDYGYLDKDKWDKELDYFLSRVFQEGEDDILSEVVETYKLHDFVHNPKTHDIDESNEYEIGLVNEATKEYVNTLLNECEECFCQEDIDITQLDPVEYENYCADILKQNGWEVQLTKATNDQGVDILAKIDGLLMAIQCKKYANPVGNKAVQEVYSGGKYYQADAYAVVAPVEYTSSAKELAKTLKVNLYHHDDLAGLYFPKKLNG